MDIKYDELTDKLLEIEQKYQFFDLDYNGIKYWKYARYYVYRVLLKKMYDIATPWLEKNSSDQNSGDKRVFTKIWDSLFHNVRLSRKKDILFFTFNRRVKKGRHYISPVTDEIVKKIPYSCCTIEAPYNHKYFRHIPIRGIKYFDVWEGVGNPEKEYEVMPRGQLRKQIFQCLEKELEIKFTREEREIVFSNVNYFIMYRDELMEKYKEIIARVQPKLVFLVTSYIGEWVVLVETLNQIKIPNVEILHGYVDNHYLPYNYYAENLHDALPNYIFAYSEIQKNMVNWGIARENIRVVGFPEGEKRAQELLQKRKKEKKNEKKVITFISSMMSCMETYITDLAERINENEWKIIFKLHPNEYEDWKDRYTNLPDNVKIIDNNEHDIHYYLSLSTIVAGINSTALFEASFYPVQILILKEESCENMHILLESQRGQLVEGSEELFEKVTELNVEEIRGLTNEQIYRSNAIDNIQNELQNILQKSV